MQRLDKLADDLVDGLRPVTFKFDPREFEKRVARRQSELCFDFEDQAGERIDDFRTLDQLRWLFLYLKHNRSKFRLTDDEVTACVFIAIVGISIDESIVNNLHISEKATAEISEQITNGLILNLYPADDAFSCRTIDDIAAFLHFLRKTKSPEICDLDPVSATHPVTALIRLVIRAVALVDEIEAIKAKLQLN